MTDDPAAAEARRDRVLAAMDGHDIDVLVLGRRDDVAYVSGVETLWTAGTRPFGAACVMVRSTRQIHLLSTWDAGVPGDVAFEYLYGITWNPRIMGAAMASITGLRGARRVGVDALSPGFAKAVRGLAPGAEVVAADMLMHAVRRTKTPAERAAIAAAVTVATDGLLAVRRAISPGATERDLAGVAVEAMARAGATVPASAPTVRLTSPGVTIDLGVLLDGWEGGLGRTYSLGSPSSQHRALEGRVQDCVSALVEACRPGATGPDLRAAAPDSGTWMVRGVGMGFEPPVITAALGADATLEPSMMLSVEVDRNEAGVGIWHVRHLVAVTDGAPELLTLEP